MSENIGGAKPALAAHSKDGSASGQTAASKATAPKAAPPSDSMSDTLNSMGETLNKMTSEACAFAREKPLTTAAIVGMTGILIGLLLGRSSA
jgi:ElaB/YqjD/DUF883 family membrane-anchored ribosome-binding protein